MRPKVDLAVDNSTKFSIGPTNTRFIIEKIDSGRVKVCEGKRVKMGESCLIPPVHFSRLPRPSPILPDIKFLAALRHCQPATTRTISDMVGFKNPDLGRQAVRHRMKKLAAEGLVKVKRQDVETAAGKTYRLKVYSLAEVRV